jgi:hypothetical protein
MKAEFGRRNGKLISFSPAVYGGSSNDVKHISGGSLQHLKLQIEDYRMQIADF